MTILEKIVQNKKKELIFLKKKKPLQNLQKEVSKKTFKKISFFKALQNKKPVAVIAEIKKKSPSKGIIRKNFNPAAIAKAYEKGGASALSVLTDQKFFAGSAEILKTVRQNTKLPILRKDFVVDEYQIWEAKLIGANAVLLIAEILSAEEMKKFYALASKLGLDVLFEAHSAKELKKIMALKPKIVGINNRDLKTFEVDLKTTEKLALLVHKKALLVAESGIFSYLDLLMLKSYGAEAVLVGESLMREPNIQQALRKLTGSK